MYACPLFHHAAGGVGEPFGGESPEGNGIGRGAEGCTTSHPERLADGHRHGNYRHRGAQDRGRRAGPGVVDHRGRPREQQGVRYVPDGEDVVAVGTEPGTAGLQDAAQPGAAQGGRSVRAGRASGRGGGVDALVADEGGQDALDAVQALGDGLLAGSADRRDGTGTASVLPAARVQGPISCDAPTLLSAWHHRCGMGGWSKHSG
ncbi:hypothetical protein GCM10010358_14440 [Streptomyces minutiscleroticus]|uniref:Uncharacterized protein n=1 Tax=Streptomyces minutiscleroticus TaxID=68238 RepID=A0A918NBU2_9ACTN|nr:hypothetical protein GCM10010358_14440 [Streptomyces minutiscleroticus]